MIENLFCLSTVLLLLVTSINSSKLSNSEITSNFVKDDSSNNLFPIYRKTITVPECGLRHFKRSRKNGQRIVGGREAEVGEYPWQIWLRAIKVINGLKYEGLCGGSLINENWLLTAAHCVTKVGNGAINVYSLAAYAGVHSRTKFDSNVQKRYADCIIPYQKWRGVAGNLANDIALVRLPTNRPFNITYKYNGTVNGICLPPKQTPPFEYLGEAEISGWGYTLERRSNYSSDDQESDALKATKVTVIEDRVCRRAPVIGKDILPSMLCQSADRTAPCVGDSGGPLIVVLNGTAVQLGIDSFGPEQCADPKIPGAVYTQVSYYIDWIENTVRKYSGNGVKCPTKSIVVPV